FRRAILDRHILAVDVTGILETLPDGIHTIGVGSGPAGERTPTTGIVRRCARAASGHAVAPPPSSVMNSPRLTRSPRRPQEQQVTRNFEVDRSRRFQIDDKLVFGRLLDRSAAFCCNSSARD